MFYFNGCTCSHCGAELKETDDIVACPVCGSPHHRSCYMENGGCANEGLHEEGFSWSRSSTGSDDSDGSNAENKVIFCGVCGAENSNGRMYCHNCGKPLSEDAANSNGYDSPYSSYNQHSYGISDDEKIDDVPIRDIRRFLGGVSMMYAPLFYQMQKLGKKVCFNLFALLLPSFWFLNRKMYVNGLLIVLFNLINYVYSSLFYGVYTLLFDAAISFDSDQVMEVFNKYPIIVGGFFALSIVSYIISLIAGFWGNNMYKKWTVRRIKRLRAKAATTDEYNSLLEANSHSGTPKALFIMLVYFALTLVAEKFIPILI